jgi:hypothetical protein
LYGKKGKLVVRRMQEVRIGIAGDQGQRLSQSCRAWTRSSAILIPLLFEDSWKPQKEGE